MLTLIVSCILSFNIINAENTLYNGIYSQTKEQFDSYESKLRLIDFIKISFQEQYAPFLWKKTNLNWNWEEKVFEAKNCIKTTTNTKEFHKILKKLLMSTKDPHVEISFTKGKEMTLPIKVVIANERLMVSDVDKNKCSIEPKDEILLINGEVAIAVYKKFLIEQFGSENNIQKSFIRKHPRFTNRKDSKADEMPKDKIWNLLLIKPNGKKYNTKIEWEESSEQLSEQTEDYFYACMNKKETFGKKNTEKPISIFYNNSNKSFIPDIGNVCFSFNCFQSDGMHAYISTLRNKNIGFLRISNYSSLNIKKLESIIRKMETDTDILILDLTNNPGGYLETGMHSLSFLSNKPLLMPKFIIKIDHEIFCDAIEKFNMLNMSDSLEKLEEIMPEFILKNIHQDEKEELLENIKLFYEDIINNWKQGNDTSNKHHYMGIKKIFPNQICYSKPILMIINEGSSSCAELVAATLQDNEIAHSFGAETSGAGGFVKECFLTNLHGIIKWTTTSSILFRINDKPIECLGVKPEITHEISWQDLIGDFNRMKNHIEDITYRILKYGKIHIGVR